MVGKEIISEKPVSIAQVRQILEDISKKSDLRYEQRLALAYAQEFAKLTAEESEQLYKELVALNIPRLKDEHIVKIIDILPRTPSELNVILAKDKISLKKELQNEILSVVKKYIPE